MKDEKNVQARKSRDYPLGKAQGGSSRNPVFGTKLRGAGGPLTPFEHLVGPTGDDEGMSIDVPGNQREPVT